MKSIAVNVLLGTLLTLSTLSVWAQTVTYRLDGRYPGIASEWVEVEYSDIHPNHIDRVKYWNTAEEPDSLEIIDQHHQAYAGGGAYTGTLRFPISGDQYTYAINSAGFVLSDGTADSDPAVFELEE